MRDIWSTAPPWSAEALAKKSLERVFYGGGGSSVASERLEGNGLL